jgi:GPI mannosyltransferase 3
MKKTLLAAFILHVFAAWFSIGRFHADEQYQILEFAAYKTGKNPAEVLPWEFHDKIRPAIQVGFTTIIMYSCTAIGVTNPFTQVFFLRLLASLFALYSIYVLLRHFDKLDKKLYNLLLFLSLFWCFIPWFHARFSSENICASLFVIGLFLFIPRYSISKTETLNQKMLQQFVAALLMGLAGVVRFQANFFIVGLFIWLLLFQRAHIKTLLVFCLGVLIANGIGLLADKWFYGTWEITGWNYFYQNIVLHKAENFGREPIWYFFEHTITDAMPPFSILIIASFLFLYYKMPKSYLTWATGVFFIAHLASPHKEERFLFPLIPFIPIFMVLAYKHILESKSHVRLQHFFASKFSRIMKTVFICVNFILLAYFTFKPADEYTSTLKYLYHRHNGSPTVMICDNHGINPYTNEVSLNLYRSSSIVVSEDPTKLDSLKSIYPSSAFIYVSENRKLTHLQNKPLQREYSSLPDWILSFNFNNWVDRVNMVNIYTIH